ncbi:MAG: hypothetical protein CAPSK01_004627 [Candidatus Accumulibacter vicinus]|uniref:Uncharacterized protein n=1 Tax=Candidatus Accumulibacter vicinus TaxID=2954382 RepID=A0A084XUI8_9PROT|nr:MAG: hypothetical protein CAPSK01_004627 [Candidatus Accumulibacter vicinus]
MQQQRNRGAGQPVVKRRGFQVGQPVREIDRECRGRRGIEDRLQTLAPGAELLDPVGSKGFLQQGWPGHQQMVQVFDDRLDGNRQPQITSVIECGSLSTRRLDAQACRSILGMAAETENTRNDLGNPRHRQPTQGFGEHRPGGNDLGRDDFFAVPRQCQLQNALFHCHAPGRTR